MHKIQFDARCLLHCLKLKLNHLCTFQLADVPGIDALYQAMDMEEGVEVVWNEINIACVPLEDDNLVKLCEKLIKLTKVEVYPKFVAISYIYRDCIDNLLVF